MEFFSALALSSSRAHLTLRGELDAFAALQLRCRLDEAVDRGCLMFTVDASAVTFLDAGGLGLFVWLSNTVLPYGGCVTVVAASRRFQQVAEFAGLGEAFGLDLLPDSAGVRCGGRRATVERPERDRLRIVNPRSAIPAPPPVASGGAAERTTT